MATANTAPYFDVKAMIKYLPLLLLIFPSYSFACSCRYERSIEEVAKSSDTIFYGEVIGIEMVGEFVESGKEQEYEVTLRPQKALKGKPKEKYTIQAFEIYNDEDSDKITVGGCGLDLMLGAKYILLIEKKYKPSWSWCSEHILPKGTKKYEYFTNEIESKL